MTVRILEKRKDSEHVNHRQVIQNVIMISVAVKRRRRGNAIMALIILLNYQYFAMVDGMRGTTGASALIMKGREKGLAKKKILPIRCANA